MKDGVVVKGVRFESLKIAGDPVKLAEEYCNDWADEIFFLDISASREGRKTMVSLAKMVAAKLDIPFTIGGGISSVEDARKVLSNGADKVAINTSAVRNPELVGELRDIFGQQCVVVSIDARRNPKTNSGFSVCTLGGTFDTGLDAVDLAKEVERRGAGEIVLTSIDRDGTGEGYDKELNNKVGSEISIPLIASGGCGKMGDFFEVFKGENSPDAALAASVFHYGAMRVQEVKRYLRSNGVAVRL